MKVLITLFTAVLLSQALSAQTTLIPDANFEQALIDRGYDTGTPDGSVPTANISSIDTLNIWSKGISDLTGIEDFVALTRLLCAANQLTSLDIGNNTGLTSLYCGANQLTSLDISNNTGLTSLYCDNNQLTSLDLSQNTALTSLDCRSNQLTSLDVSNNTALTFLICSYNQLVCLNVKNGNNTNMTWFVATDNPNLTCIEVVDSAWSTANWTVANGSIDGTASFSTDCNNPCSSPTGIPEQSFSFKLYPNPVTSSLVVETRYPLQLAIYNVQGKLMVDKAISSTYTMDLSELARGIYFLTATDEQGRVYSQKVVKE